MPIENLDLLPSSGLTITSSPICLSGGIKMALVELLQVQLTPAQAIGLSFLSVRHTSLAVSSLLDDQT